MTVPAEQMREDSLYAKGSVVPSERNVYGDRDVSDEAYWAACELFATTGDDTYYDYLEDFSFSGTSACW